MTDNEDVQRALGMRTQCWDAALHAYGTSAIFEHRSRVLKNWLRWLTYISFGVPMIIGLLVLGYGEFGGLTAIIGIGAAVLIVQVALSFWSIVGGWVESYSYVTAAIPANHLLSDKFAELAANPPSDSGQFQHEYEKLQVEDRLLQQQDYQQDIKAEEKRMGMRAALRKFSRACAGCGETPSTMSPGTCDICGNFRYRTL
jgi:mobilome CxxCx(11)CxxC protein